MLTDEEQLIILQSLQLYRGTGLDERTAEVTARLAGLIPHLINPEVLIEKNVGIKVISKPGMVRWLVGRLVPVAQSLVGLGDDVAAAFADYRRREQREAERRQRDNEALNERKRRGKARTPHFEDS